MGTVRASWVLPTKRKQGGDLPVSEIAGVEIEISVDGALWGPAESFPPDVLTTDFTELEFGTWFFRAAVRTTDGQLSAPVVNQIDVPDTSAAEPVQLTLELV